MSGYRYEAIAPDGRVQRGGLESDSPRQVRARLREQGMLPTPLTTLDPQNVKTMTIRCRDCRERR